MTIGHPTACPSCSSTAAWDAVLSICLDHLAARREPTERVSVQRVLSTELLVLAAQRPVQVVQHELLQLLPDGCRVRHGEHGLSVMARTVAIRTDRFVLSSGRVRGVETVTIASVPSYSRCSECPQEHGQ
jgi:hypothetical protein